MSAYRKRRISGILPLIVLVNLYSAAMLVGQSSEGPRKSVGLALSGGGARGAAEIGVLKVLEREGVRIDCIAATSFGAIVGWLHASGYSAEEIETFVLDHWQEIFTNQPERALAPLVQDQTLRQLVHLTFSLP